MPAQPWPTPEQWSWLTQQQPAAQELPLSPFSILDGPSNKRALHVREVWCREFYDGHRATVEATLAARRTELGHKPRRQETLSITRTEIDRQYSLESPEVKADVFRRWEEEKAVARATPEKVAGQDHSPEQYQHVHLGRNQSGHTFAQANSGFRDQCVRPLVHFAKGVYPKDVQRKRALKSPTSPATSSALPAVELKPSTCLNDSPRDPAAGPSKSDPPVSEAGPSPATCSASSPSLPPSSLPSLSVPPLSAPSPLQSDVPALPVALCQLPAIMHSSGGDSPAVAATQSAAASALSVPEAHSQGLQGDLGFDPGLFGLISNQAGLGLTGFDHNTMLPMDDATGATIGLATTALWPSSATDLDFPNMPFQSFAATVGSATAISVFDGSMTSTLFDDLSSATPICDPLMSWNTIPFATVWSGIAADTSNLATLSALTVLPPAPSSTLVSSSALEPMSLATASSLSSLSAPSLPLGTPLSSPAMPALAVIATSSSHAEQSSSSAVSASSSTMLALSQATVTLTSSPTAPAAPVSSPATPASFTAAPLSSPAAPVLSPGRSANKRPVHHRHAPPRPDDSPQHSTSTTGSSQYVPFLE
ncbi:hypothetical protein ACG7TL_005436 [Trametes sanguinea]